ncbi:MAG: chromate transporter [Christensenellales bacterium]
MIWEIFITFFKIGLFSIGGGYSVLSLIQQETTVTKAWITASEFIDIVTISEIVPGAVSINLATYIGFKMSGVLGAIVATIAVVIAPVIIMIILVKFFIKLQKSKQLEETFLGLRYVTVGLIASVAITIAQTSFFDFGSVLICLAAFIASYQFKVDPIFLILISGVIGYLLY